MRRGTGTAVLGDDRHHLGQRRRRRDVAVDELERLPVMGADTHLEAGDAEVRIDHRPAHLQTGHLAGHDAVLGYRRGAGRLDEGQERQPIVGHRRRRQIGRRFGGDQRPALGPPHARRGREPLGPAAQHRRRAGVVDDDVERAVVSVLAGPRQGGAEGPLGPIVGEDPHLAVAPEGGARREWLQNGRTPVRMVTDEGTELQAEQRRTALRVRRHFLALAPLRWP
jgi:hypothetical protein